MKKYQQGDVILRKVENIDTSKLKKLEHLVLAEGEATGHKHEVIGDAELYADENRDIYLEVADKATLTHPEHKPIILPKGKYKVEKPQEYDHFAEEARKVRD